MDCKQFEVELMDLVLTAGAKPSLGAVAHMRVCPPCAEEYLGFQNTFTLLDTWTAPEPTPYFNQRLAVRVREEQAAPPMGWLEQIATRLRLNTGRNFGPVMAGALALALVAGGSGYAGLSSSFRTAPSVKASATVNDLQILDRNQQAFQQMDELQQDDVSTRPEVMNQPAPPSS